MQKRFPRVKPFIQMHIFCNKQLATVWIKICVNCNFIDNRVICYIKTQLKYPSLSNLLTERGSCAESKNCEILSFPTADRRFDKKVKCPIGQASFWVKFPTVQSLTRVKCGVLELTGTLGWPKSIYYHNQMINNNY